MPTPSLRNLNRSKADLKNAIAQKIHASLLKQSGRANDIDNAYAAMNITEEDASNLAAFLSILNDVSDTEFRNLILNTTLLDTSKDIE